MSDSEKKLDTLCIHAGQTIDPATGAVMPPIYTSTTFEHEAFGQAGAYSYSRGANPTRGALERCVAELEGGARGFAYASGMAATAAVLELLAAGSHVITQRGIYGGTLRLFNQVRRHSAGLDFTFVEVLLPHLQLGLVLVKEGAARLIRRRESYQDLMAMDVV